VGNYTTNHKSVYMYNHSIVEAGWLAFLRRVGMSRVQTSARRPFVMPGLSWFSSLLHVNAGIFN
jgi:hypothetical protein